MLYSFNCCLNSDPLITPIENFWMELLKIYFLGDLNTADCVEANLFCPLANLLSTFFIFDSETVAKLL